MCQTCFESQWEGRNPRLHRWSLPADELANITAIVAYYRTQPGWEEGSRGWAGDCLHAAIDDDNYDNGCYAAAMADQGFPVERPCDHPKICALWAELDEDARSFVVADLHGYTYPPP